MKRQSIIARNSKRNLREIQKYYTECRGFILDMFHSVLSDFVNLNPLYRDVDLARDYKTLEMRISSEGLGFISVTLPQLMQDLFCKIEGGTPSYDGWKKHSHAEYPAFLGRLFGEVYARGPYEAVSFGQIYMICSIFKKLKGPFRESSLHRNLCSFKVVDQEIGAIDYRSDVLGPIILDASNALVHLFERMSDKYLKGFLKPRPGPGATNTPVDKYLRFRPHAIYEPLDDEFGYLDWYYKHHWDPVEDAKRYMCLPQKGDAESRFKFVPKYLFKPRGICIEENEMQFFQQSLKGFLYEWIESHPATRGRINFTHQSVNRNHALTSSISKEYATIDMSDASDRVSRELVHRLFMRTALLEPLDAVSTRRIKLPDGTTIYAHKFAPMGSGVCFPVMALVHWALICSIIRLSVLPDSEKVAQRVYVYGDDIIFPVEACEAVYTYLPLFGMKLNKTKSFYRSSFRESCGIHAYNGLDVTPVYVNYVNQLNQDRNDTTTLLSLIAKEQLFNKRGYSETARCIRKHVHSTYWLLPFVGEASPILGWRRDGRSDYRRVVPYARRRRYNADLQTPEVSLQCVVPKKEPPTDLHDGDGYLRKLLTNADEASTMPGSVEELTVRRRWVSVQAI